MENLERLDPKLVRRLGADSDVGTIREKVRALTRDVERLRVREDEFLRSWAIAEHDAERLDELAKLRGTRLGVSREMVAAYLEMRRLLDRDSPKQLGLKGARVLPADMMAALLRPVLEGCVAVNRSVHVWPLYVEVLDEVYGDKLSPQLVGIGVDFDTAEVTSLRYVVEGFGPAWMRVQAAWGFIAPNDPALCGFEVASAVELTGWLENKASSSVLVELETWISQYRTMKALTAINLGVDPTESVVSATCMGNNNAPYRDGYLDSIYGWHGLTPLHARLDCAYAYPGGIAPLSVAADDRMVVTTTVEIDVGASSYVLFADPRPNPTPPIYGGFTISAPTITFYAPSS